jgi:hypothetical protein
VARAAKAAFGMSLLPHPHLTTQLTNSPSATQAKCSCGEKSALQCTCGKAETENTVTGPRCSCRTSLDSPLILSHHVLTIKIGARPAGSCTCDRAATENSTPSGSVCSCGSRPAGMHFVMFLAKVMCQMLTNIALDACTCEEASDGGLLPTETDFTTKA